MVLAHFVGALVNLAAAGEAEDKSGGRSHNKMLPRKFYIKNNVGLNIHFRQKLPKTTYR